jgi:hypothetical protein
MEPYAIFVLTGILRLHRALDIPIPNDLAECRALIQQQIYMSEQLHRDKQELEAAYAQLIQRAFRHRSERYIKDPNQLQLDCTSSVSFQDLSDKCYLFVHIKVIGSDIPDISC